MRCLGEVGVRWLINLFNKIWLSKKIPNEWRKSTLVPLYKNKGDIQSCSNYHEIKLMCHTMKLWERVIEHRLRQNVKISENQLGFIPGAIDDRGYSFASSTYRAISREEEKFTYGLY